MEAAAGYACAEICKTKINREENGETRAIQVWRLFPA